MSDPATISKEVDMTKWLLNGKKMPKYFRDSILSGKVEMTIEGGSSLTLVMSDDTNRILKSKLFFGGDRYTPTGIRSAMPAEKPVRMRALDLDWQLTGVDRAADRTLTLTFEDLRIALARTYKKAKKVSRNKKTRAEFIKSMWAEIKRPRIKFVCTQLHTKQQKASASSSDKDDDRGKGFAKNVRLKIKGTQADKDQLKNLDEALSAADGEDATEHIMVALVAAAIQENNCRNSGTDGMFQVLPSTARALGINSKDIGECAEVWVSGKNGNGFRGAGKYAKKIVENDPDISVNDLAQEVEGSAHPNLYGQWKSEAEKIVSAFGGGKSSSDGTTYKKYEFSRGLPGGKKNENTWDASQRLASEVGWRCFVVRDKVYYMSEEDLIRSRPRMTIDEDTKGIDSISFKIDANTPVDECTVECDKTIWSCPPGSTLLIENTGPADGRWLVVSISREDIWDVDSVITLRRGSALLQEKKEPAPEGSSSSLDNQSGTAGAVGDVKVASGANRAGSSIADNTMDFIKEVAGEYGKTITVTTGTNHSRLTVDGNVSDHYDGHAVDIAVPVDSAKGDAICKAALICAGLSESEATSKARSGGLFNVNDGGLRIQIIWKTNEGGNHHNHVHIGAK